MLHLVTTCMHAKLQNPNTCTRITLQLVSAHIFEVLEYISNHTTFLTSLRFIQVFNSLHEFMGSGSSCQVGTDPVEDMSADLAEENFSG